MDRNGKNLRTLSSLFIIVALCNIATFVLALLLRTEVITELMKAERGIMYIIILAVVCSLISVVEIIIAVKGFQKAKGMGVGNGHIGLSWVMLIVTLASLVLTGYEVSRGRFEIEVVWQPLTNVLMIYEFLRFAGILNHDRKKAAKEAEKAAKEAEKAAKEEKKQERSEEIAPAKPEPLPEAPEIPEEISEPAPEPEDSLPPEDTEEKRSAFIKLR
mgnify:CR=1 FL=1